MKYLSFDNTFMSLWIASHSKIQCVAYLSIETETPKGHSLLGMQGERHVYGLQYPSDSIPSNRFETRFDNGFFIRCSGHFFEVSLITNSEFEANEAMTKDDSIALICTDNAGFHYVVSVDKTNIK
ncbi:hypothetical protein [Moritella sp. F3]|uniref:hypothetical protein n=1 Tax=Moritella sp. F3 TaxID=2718882 RepID=UPI0018E0CCBC|nr:hypothetical protein [Moritella sp. F3]GIC77706.1 hypothetical protein FMO001_24330 [Moritella sp. F1]GIC82119.1 hypothetical protein FMO003_24000 [Moritella sp. F3]